jgi:hypothetical protein
MDTTLTINDLTTVVTIIDVCTSRGAFKGPEILEIGQLREKLVSVINENKPAEEEVKAGD